MKIHAWALAGAVGAASAAWGQCEPLEDPIPGAIEQTGVSVTLDPIATGLTSPLWLTTAPSADDRLIVVDQMGIVWAIDAETGDKSVFLDVSERLVELGAFGEGSYDERGLLGIAFHPDYAANGLLYTYESHPVGPEADYSTMPDGETADHQNVITEWTVDNPDGPLAEVNPESARELLRIDHPQFNHNGGAMAFGPDGFLYFSIGDGGAGDDQGIGHGEEGNAQNINSILGKVIRIDPLGDNSPNGKYGIPDDNPFVGVDGLDEIYAYGFRNPYRFSFDTATGDLWLGDAGQNDIEEVDTVTLGGNYGWRHKEGSFFFMHNGEDDGFVCDEDPGVPPDLIDPVAEYDHDEGVVVVGGFVYHGSLIPELAGRYVFGDFSADGEGPGRLFHLDDAGGIVEFQYAGAPFDAYLLGFGQDAAGEVYVLSNATSTPFEETGIVWRLSTATCGADCDGNGVLDAGDFACFQAAFDAGGETADCNGDGQHDLFDFLCFINLFNAGCP
jgi:glucose/arabinose dehydrogenase